MLEDFISTHTKKQLLGLQMFLNTEEKGFILTGQDSSGKTSTINKLLQTPLNTQILFIRFNCFPSTSLDDLLLFVFDKYKAYFKLQKITPPKPQSKAISDGINALTKFVDKPVVIIVDSFENITNENTRNDIACFLTHISSVSNTKFIIASRTEINTEKLFREVNLLSSRIKKMDEDAFYEYTFELGLDEPEEDLTELSKLAKEKFLPVQLTSKLTKILNTPLKNFLSSYVKNENDFNKFLLNKLISLMPDKYFNLLWFFAIYRYALNESCINSLQMINKQELDYLVNRGALTYENELFFMQEELKASVLEKASSEVLKKIHTFLISFYEQKLTQKPFERGILISRTSARNEIEYHTNFHQSLKKESHNTTPHTPKETPMSYVSYTKGAGFDWSNIEFPKVKQEENIGAKTSDSDVQASTQTSQAEIKEFGLTEVEIELLNTTNSEIVSIIETKTTQNAEKTLNDYLNLAAINEENFEYANAITNYNKALEQHEDEMYEVKEPLILTKLGISYKKSGSFDKALETFNKALSIYENSQETVKSNYIKLNIAKLYAENYKIAPAKEIYEEILKNKQSNPNQLNLSCYLALGEIEDNLSNTSKAKSFYENALQFTSDDIQDELLLAQAYFKYALILDDTMQTEEATKYYDKCIEVSHDSKENVYLPLAYSNIAAIYQEKKEYQNAINYYTLALKIDENKKNNEGLCFIYSKLGALYSKSDEKLAVKMFLSSLKNAKKLSDYFYTASAYTELGDFYYSTKADNKALKAYIYAKKILEQASDTANSEKITTRIEDLKARMNFEAFNEIMKGLNR